MISRTRLTPLSKMQCEEYMCVLKPAILSCETGIILVPGHLNASLSATAICCPRSACHRRLNRALWYEYLGPQVSRCDCKWQVQLRICPSGLCDRKSRNAICNYMFIARNIKQARTSWRTSFIMSRFLEIVLLTISTTPELSDINSIQ